MDCHVSNSSRSDKFVLSALLRIPRKLLQFQTKLKQPWKPCQVEVGEGWITVKDAKNKVVCRDQLFRLNCQTAQTNIIIQAQNIRFKLKPHSGSENQFGIFKNIIESRWDSTDAGTGSLFSSLADSKEIKQIQGFCNDIYTGSPSKQINKEKSPEESQIRADITRVQTKAGSDTMHEPNRVLIHEKTVQTKIVGVSSFQVSPKKLKGGSSDALHKYTYSVVNGLDNAAFLPHELNNNAKPQIVNAMHFKGHPLKEENKNCDELSEKENIEIGSVDLVRKPYFKSLNEIKTSMSTHSFQDKCKNELGIDVKNIESGFNVIEKTIDNEVNDGKGIENSVNVIDRTIFNQVDTKNLDKIANIIERTTTKIDRRNSVSVISSVSKKKLSDQFEKAMKNFDDQINLFKSLSLSNRENEIEKKDSNNNEDEVEEKVEHRSRAATRDTNSERIRRLSREKSREKIKNRTILKNDDTAVLKIYFS